MKTSVLALSFGAAIIVASTIDVRSASITIDDFGTQNQTVQAGQAAPGPISDAQTGIAGVIDGKRTIEITHESGVGAGNTVTSDVNTTTDRFSVSNNSGHNGIGSVTWPITTSPADLTVGGAVAFNFDTVENDLGAIIKYIVTDSSANVSTNIFEVSATETGSTTIPFSGFSNQTASAADFTSVSEIQIIVDPPAAGDYAFQNHLAIDPRDFGDAPDTYCTLEGSDGPRHTITYDGSGDPSGPLLGNTNFNVDDELVANASADATGDDADEGATSPVSDNPDTGDVDYDDETGVSAINLIAGLSTSSFEIDVTGAAGVVNAWIDWNANGDFADAGEQILTNDSRAIGNHVITLTPPVSASLGTTFMRVRISTANLPTTDGFKGAAADGEVEDHQVTVRGFDFGDALDDGTVLGTITTAFNTTTANSGASHEIIAGAALLGASVDKEGDGNPTAGANGDDTTDSPDDEDGVTGLPTVITTAGGSFPLTITVGGGTNGDVYAWADISSGIGAFGGDGDFDNFGDQFLGTFGAAYNGGGGGTMNNVTGAQNFTLNIPTTGLVAGNPIFVRFRTVNTGTAVSDATGSIANGEVEDYVIQVVSQLQDWGDAPDTYTTTAGPRHTIGTGDPQFGAERDAETAGQPSVGADGDDNTDSPDDEDGVDFASVGTINIGSTISLPITVSGAAGNINAFIDFNGDGDFLDGGEQVLSDVAQAIGTTNHNILIPGGSTPGTTYARFRISTVGGDAAASGTAADGEIEDYVITLTENLDWGDAPESGPSGNGVGTNDYGTTLANNGPRHTITGPRLGASVDSENDGQPNSDATGDGADENGVTFAACLISGIANNTPINVAGAAGKVSLWIDLNADGDFLDAGEQLLNNVPQGVSTLPYPLVIPADATAGPTFARVRVVASTDPDVTSPHGAAASGEVEDYAVTICKDYGDAPDTYCTVLASDGARHAQSGPFLGTNRDVEADAAAVAPGADATGDDTTGSPDDEDGVSFSNSGIFDTTSSSNQITFTIGSGPADVEVYVDWNRDGDFDDNGEKYDFDNHAGGTESLAVGTLTTDGVTYVRVRVYNVGEALDSPKGDASSGEVEDYRITLSTPTLVDLLAFDAAATEDGQVALNWTTGAEIDTAGFNLIRRQLGEDSAASYEPVKLNSQLIPSQGTSVEGASYEYMDTPGYGTFFYQLEDIEISGKAGLHPFREVTVLPTLNIGLDDDSNVNLNYVVLPGWDYEVEYKSLADVDADWQALPDAPHNDGAVSDEVGSEAADRLYRLKASPRE